MSIAQSLPDIVPFFMQKCPLCGRSNRMVVRGVYTFEGKSEVYPDIGYSFCNCKAIFYTRPENVTKPVSYLPDEQGMITLPDPFFIDWSSNPETFIYFNPRKYQMLWDMDSLCDELRMQGYEVISAERDFNVHSVTPQHFHIKVHK